MDGRASAEGGGGLFSVGSIVSTAQHLLDKGFLTHTAISGFFTALSEVHAAAFPNLPPLAQHSVVKDMRNAAKKSATSTLPPKSQPYFSLWSIFANILVLPPLRECSSELIRTNLAVLIAMDIGSRGQELASIVRYKLTVSGRGIRGFLWNTKEVARPCLVQFEIQHSHSPSEDAFRSKMPSQFLSYRQVRSTSDGVGGKECHSDSETFSPRRSLFAIGGKSVAPSLCSTP